MKKIIRLENGNVKVQTINNEPTKTQQQFKDQCDINLIMKKYRETGQISHLRNSQGQYLDVSELPSYQEALNTLITANNSFASLSSEVRKRFGNDPKNMIEFLSDPSNDPEAIKLGLKISPPSTTPNPNSPNQPDPIPEPKSKSKKSNPDPDPE